jgi:hypothetical protein
LDTSSQSETRSAADTLLQSIDLAVEAERLGMDGAYFRVHHFAQQLASPFPLLAAVGAKTQKIEIGTAVIDMRYENPHYMVEDAGAADIISGGRLQLGISRGSPDQVIDGWRYFGYSPREGEDDVEMGRRHAEEFFELLRGKGFARPNPRPMFPNPPGLLRLEPYSEGLRDRIWWGWADSRNKCNMYFCDQCCTKSKAPSGEEEFCWCFPTEGLSRPRVELPCDVVELLLGEQGQVRSFGQVLAQQTVGVFADAPLPWGVWMHEVDMTPVSLVRVL